MSKRWTSVRCTPPRDACPCEVYAPVRCTTVSSLASTFLCWILYWTHFGFRISAGKITTLLAVKSVDAGSTQACTSSDHLGRPEGTLVCICTPYIHSRVTSAGGEN